MIRKRFLVIGGYIYGGGTHVTSAQLMQLCKIDRRHAILHSTKEDSHLIGIDLSQYTQVTPRVDGRYGIPQVDIPITKLTNTIKAGFVACDKSGWMDVTFNAMFADALEELEFNDPNFPWLLFALRDPLESPFIYTEIWRKLRSHILLINLHAFMESQKDKTSKELNDQIGIKQDDHTLIGFMETSDATSSEKKSLEPTRRKVRKRMRK